MEGYKIKIGKYGEINLITSMGDEILFVEVKTWTSNEYGYPEQAMNYFKIKHYSRPPSII